MKVISLLMALLFSASLQAESLCFSPVKEKIGDKGAKRNDSQPFDYTVQVDDGPLIIPSETESTRYKYSSASPMVKIYLAAKPVESFRITRNLLQEGRNCVFFKNIYETWSIAEAWQSKRLCTC